MSLSMHTVLVELVDMAGEEDEPVGQPTLAASLSVPEAALTDPLDSLREFELVAASARGYRPTVTAHELLAAGIELDDALVMDTVEE
jgi:predicted transcriptional regulator